jgi:AI-2 transport protein TqsA
VTELDPSQNETRRNIRDQTVERGLRAFPVGQSLLYVAAFVVTIAGLRAAAAIVVPFLLAVFFSILCAQPLNALQRKLPFPVAISVVLATLLAVFMGIPVLIGGSLRQVLGDLPELQQQIRGLEATVAGHLDTWEVGIPVDDLSSPFDPAWATSLLSLFLNGLLRTFSDGILVLVMTGFMLTEASWFSAKVARLDSGSGEGSRRIKQIVLNSRRYVGVKTLVSLATGLCVWLGLWTLGIDYAAVWGFIAFLFNYVPTIGSMIAGIPPIVLALLQGGLGIALAVSVLYLVVNQMFGSVIEPRLQGKGLGLSPLVVFVSLIFWGWVFGPVGMLLSAPITMVIRIACDEFEETQWITVMLGGHPGVSARGS